MFYGLGLDSESRCLHYASQVDIVALKCQDCHKYYACYQCHDAMEEHAFKATDSSEPFPVICGHCQTYLSRWAYEAGACPNGSHAFNPRCQEHKQTYFTTD